MDPAKLRTSQNTRLSPLTRLFLRTLIGFVSVLLTSQALGCSASGERGGIWSWNLTLRTQESGKSSVDLMLSGGTRTEAASVAER